jgi:hypothetical protein
MLGSPTFQHDAGSAVCVHKTDGTAWCLGYGAKGGARNAGVYWGQFRTNDGLEPGATWKQWGTRTDIAELTTGTMDAVCARYTNGEADCAGLSCGLAGTPQTCPLGPVGPVDVSGGAVVASLWQDIAGQVHANEAAVLRVGNGRTGCVILPQGLVCDAGPVVNAMMMAGAEQYTLGWFTGTRVTHTDEAGTLVDGNQAGMESVCWLNASGEVYCRKVDPASPPSPGRVPPMIRYFAGGTVIALAANPYSPAMDGTTLCAVYNDFSLWCVGENREGKLGTGAFDSLAVETQVLGPDSVGANCADR